MTSPLSVLSRVRPPISRGVPARRPRTPDVRATSPVLSTSFAFVLGAGVTALILFTEWFPAGYRAGALSAQVNTVDGCIALLVAYLSHGRFGRDRRIRYRLIGHGLAVFGAAALLLPVVAQLLPQQAPGAADTWASAVIRLTGTGLIAAGALARDSVIDYRRPRWAVAAVPAIALAVPLALFRAIAPALPPALIPVG